MQKGVNKGEEEERYEAGGKWATRDRERKEWTDDRGLICIS